MRVVLPLIAAAALSLAACGSEDTRAVELYCQYGAVSQAQLDGCVDHVGIEDVRARDTNAARYAMNSLDECLGDAGPFCKNEPYAVDPNDD